MNKVLVSIITCIVSFTTSSLFASTVNELLPNERNNVEIFQNVTCLTVDGNSAWIRSQIVKTSHPDEELFKVGTEYVTLVRDFGVNGTDVMHSISLKVIQSECGNAQLSCSDKPALRSMETVVSSGDYQVR